MTEPSPKIIVAITGASGVLYAQRLIDLLEKAECIINVIPTTAGDELLKTELKIKKLTAFALIGRPSQHVIFHDNDNMFNPLASGSNHIDAMVFCPCSANSLASIATGLANTLVLRAAQVSLKQRRPLILLHRETPLSEIEIKNMLTVTQAGAIVMPASPGFYMNPRAICDLVDMIIARILDLLKIPHNLTTNWTPP